MSRTRALTLVVALLCAAGLGRAAAADAAELLYAVDTQNRLVSFDSEHTTSIKRIPFAGLPAGEQIVGIDVRPANGQIIGLGSTSRLYRIDVSNGQATAIGAAPFAPALSGTSFGFDFNPTVDRIRLTSDARQDLRLHPDTGATAATDGTLTYATGDPGAATEPRVVASAYTNSTAGATTTTLFNLDAARNTLVIQNPPNNGTLVTVGPLGLTVGPNAGFDIAGSDGVAYAALQIPGNDASSALHRINLTTGAATLIGRIGGRTPIRALAAAGTAPADTAAPTVAIAGRVTASARVGQLLRTGVRSRATCSEGCTLRAELRIGSRVVGSGKAVTTDLAGSAPLRLVFRTTAKKQLAANRRLAVTLVVTATDAFGNDATVRRTIRATR